MSADISSNTSRSTHPRHSTNMSTYISVDTRPICWPIRRSTVGRYVNQYVGRGAYKIHMIQTNHLGGSSVLKTSAIECRSIPSIASLIDPRSILHRHLDRYSIETRLTYRSPVGPQTTNVCRHIVECRSILAVITRSLSVDTWPTYRSLPYGQLSVACLWHWSKAFGILNSGL